MSSAKDISIPLLVQQKELSNGQTGEVFATAVVNGYTLYKGKPVYRVRGLVYTPKSYNNKETGKPFSITKMSLNFYHSEDREDDVKEDFTLYLRLDEKTNRSKGNKFTAVTSEDLFYGKGDDKNTKGFKLGNLHIPLNGIIESNPIVDNWGNEVQKLVLGADNKYSLNIITKDMLASDDTRVGYVAQTNDELFTQEELDGLSQEFKYFEKFNSVINGEIGTEKEKVVPISF